MEDKKLLQLTERQTERVRCMSSHVLMGTAVVNLQDIQSKLALLV